MNDLLTLFDLGAPKLDGPWELREVTQATAEAWCNRYHYLGSCPESASHRVAVFAPEMVGIVIYNRPTNASGISGKFDLDAWPGNHEIARVAVHPEAAFNTTSKLIAAANRFVRTATGLEWLFSYADTGQGHHGGIYQALNAVYVGVSAGSDGWLCDGIPMHPRSVVAAFGTRAKANAPTLAEKAGKTLVYTEGLNTEKHTYILPIGTPAIRRAIRWHLRPFEKPYPKRSSPSPSP